MLIREIDTKEEFTVVLELLKDLNDGKKSDETEMLKNWRKMQQYPYFKVFLAELDGKIVGTFCILICHNIGHHGKKFAILENVVITPEMRGHGLGKQMMAEALELAKKENCYKVMLSSNIKRLDAHRFYENLGFRQHGISFMVEDEQND